MVARPYRLSMHTILLHTKPAFDRSGHAPGTLAVSVYEGGALVYQGQQAESKLCESWGFLSLCQVVRSPLLQEHPKAEACSRGGVRVSGGDRSFVSSLCQVVRSALLK